MLTTELMKRSFWLTVMSTVIFVSMIGLQHRPGPTARINQQVSAPQAAALVWIVHWIDASVMPLIGRLMPVLLCGGGSPTPNSGPVGGFARLVVVTGCCRMYAYEAV